MVVVFVIFVVVVVVEALLRSSLV